MLFSQQGQITRRFLIAGIVIEHISESLLSCLPVFAFLQIRMTQQDFPSKKLRLSFYHRFDDFSNFCKSSLNEQAAGAQQIGFLSAWRQLVNMLEDCFQFIPLVMQE